MIREVAVALGSGAKGTDAARASRLIIKEIEEKP
jgi:hypothetical protein